MQRYIFGEVDAIILLLLANTQGQLANNDLALTLSTPTLVNINIPILQISCGEEHILLLTINKQLYVCGSNNFGALGIASDDYDFVQTTPVLIPKLSHLKIDRIVSGWNHSIAILDCGSAYSWGRGDFGQLGNRSEQDFIEPEPMEIYLNGTWVPVRDASCGARHTIAIAQNGAVFGTGSNESGQLGTGTRNRLLRFTLIPMNEKIIQSACGASHSVLLTKEQKVYSCGSNNLFQLGLGSQVRYSLTPNVIPGLNDIIEIACGNHSAALDENGQLFIWGQGTFGNVEKPQLFSTTKFSRIFVGGPTGAAIDQMGNIYTWGSNTNGELGLGDNENRSEPTMIQGFEGRQIYDISIGLGFCYALSQGEALNGSFMQSPQVVQQQYQGNPLEKNPQISMDLIQTEREYLQKTLTIEQQERIALEKINRDLKNQIYEYLKIDYIPRLTNGSQGVMSLQARLQEKDQHLELLKQRYLNIYFAQLATVEQNQELQETRSVYIRTQQQEQEKGEYIDLLEQRVKDYEEILKQKQSELEESQMDSLKIQEQFESYHHCEQEQLKQIKHQLNDLTIQLTHEREMREKLSTTLTSEKQTYQALLQHFKQLQENNHRADSKCSTLQSQLEGSLVQHHKLTEALQMAQKRIQNLQNHNQKLMQDFSILRTQLYHDQSKVKESFEKNLPQPMEVQAIIQLNQQLTEINQQLQNKVKEKEIELLKFKQAYNNLIDKSGQDLMQKQGNNSFRTQRESHLLRANKEARQEDQPQSHNNSNIKQQNFQNSSQYNSSFKKQQSPFEENEDQLIQSMHPIQRNTNRSQRQSLKEQENQPDHFTGSPIGKTISELLESAHKHAKFMKRLLKDIDQEEVQNRKSQIQIEAVGSKRQLQISESPSPKKKLIYEEEQVQNKEQSVEASQNDQQSMEQMNSKINQIENEYAKSLSDIKAKLVRLQGNKQSLTEKEILKMKN